MGNTGWSRGDGTVQYSGDCVAGQGGESMVGGTRWGKGKKGVEQRLQLMGKGLDYCFKGIDGVINNH